jgi:Fusaric acid resistance protein-like
VAFREGQVVTAAPQPTESSPSLMAQIFSVNPKGLNLFLGFAVGGILLVPLLVMVAIGLENYWISLAYGILYPALSDPGGEFSVRAREMSIIAVIGAVLTLWGFGIGSGAWGWVVLSVFVVVLAMSLAIGFGMHRFVSGIQLSVWFLIALSVQDAFAKSNTHVHAWGQMLAWLAGGALLLAVAYVFWLARGRKAQPSRLPEIPADMSRKKLTPAMVIYALLRAIAVAAAVAIAFGLNVPNADWMPIAALSAMKPALSQSTVTAIQRIVGVVIGAVIASVVLLTADNKHVLEAIFIVLAMVPGAIYTVSYTYYSAAVAAAVLIVIDIPHPTNLANEGQRILFTFIGVGIAVIVTYLGTVLGKAMQRRAKAATPRAEAAAPG